MKNISNEASFYLNNSNYTKATLIDRIFDGNNPDSWSYRLRKKRFNYFMKYLDVKTTDKILDVGGTESIWLGSGLETNVTLLNLKHIKKQTMFIYAEADACNMNIFGDKSYDIIFSNSVIEHVGDAQRQKQFASEVERVGKKYWIQTPYKHFPIEPHFLFPFFQYFNPKIQKVIAKNWKYSHLMRNKEDILDELSRIYLLTISEMRSLFPLGKIFTEKFLGIPKSIIVYKKDN